MILDRVARATNLLREQEIDLLVVGQSADFRYLTGHKIGLTERLTALLLPASGRPSVIVPRLSEPILGGVHAHADVRPWADGSNPVDYVVEAIEASGARRVAIAEELWSSYVLELTKRLPLVAFVPGNPIMRALRVAKTQDEVEKLAEASRIHDVVYEEFVAGDRLIGRTELDVQNQIRTLMAHHGLTEILWIDIGGGPNGASPLHPGGARVIQRGEPVVIDFAGSWEGYFGDTCRTPVAGEPSAEFTRAYATVKVAVDAAFEAVRPGVACEDLDRTARAVIESAGFGQYFLHRLGHGIGLSFHEHPYLVAGNRELLVPGMAFSIEPGIYVADSWGVRIEDIVAVTENGGRRLNNSTRELVCLS
jgi:Xaa-Pro aminopeptidase